MALKAIIGFALTSSLVLGCGAADTGDTGATPGPAPEEPDAGGKGDNTNPPNDCGSQEEPIEFVEIVEPPDMLIVLDRSGSMNSAVDPSAPFGTSPSKWEVMEDALNNLATARQADVRFGLSVFPSDDSCGVDAGTLVSPDVNQASAIASQLNGLSPGGLTPAEVGLEEALATYQGLPDNPGGRYVLFATDGTPTCDGGDSEVVSAVTALANAGVNTFVLGFGGAVADADVLNDAAIEGGVPKPNGPPHYYFADDAAGLNQALSSIANTIIEPSCSFQLNEVPEDPDLVKVSLDGTDIPRDPSRTNGWDFDPDPQTITFYGPACDAIKSGQNQSVGIVFGCPGPVLQ